MSSPLHMLSLRRAGLARKTLFKRHVKAARCYTYIIHYTLYVYIYIYMVERRSAPPPVVCDGFSCCCRCAAAVLLLSFLPPLFLLLFPRPPPVVLWSVVAVYVLCCFAISKICTVFLRNGFLQWLFWLPLTAWEFAKFAVHLRWFLQLNSNCLYLQFICFSIICIDFLSCSLSCSCSFVDFFLFSMFCQRFWLI